MRMYSTLTVWTAIALLYLHRTYLVETLIRWPEDPLKSKFALSVLAAHRSSLLIIQGLSRLQEQLSELVPRITFLYLHTFSAYVSAIPADRLPFTNKCWLGLPVCDRHSEPRLCPRSLLFGRDRPSEGTVQSCQGISSYKCYGGVVSYLTCGHK
jgi:hypothetical protein